MPDDASSAFSTIRVQPQEHGFGAEVTGLDLSRPLPAKTLAEVKDAWARHAVLSFPDQPLTLDQLEAFTLQMGPYGDDPFVKPMDGHPNVLEVRRNADETARAFGAGWHSDWSFQPCPPSATLLRSQVVPPMGGDTLFCDCAAAYDALSPTMQAMIAPLRAIHSAARPYGMKGLYATETETRSMPVIVSPEADKTYTHPLVRTHPVTGKKVLFVNRTYTVGVEGLTKGETDALLGFLLALMTEDRFMYRHKWREGMLLMWDNRRVIHMAEGGYDGHLRLMHRTTVAGEAVA